MTVRRHSRKHIPAHDSTSGGKYVLKRTDQIVLDYLNRMAREGNTFYCKVSIPTLAKACGISERQVQISTKRLIEAGLLEREGYDFSNPDYSKRGTIYKVLAVENEDRQKSSSQLKRGSVRFFLFWSED